MRPQRLTTVPRPWQVNSCIVSLLSFLRPEGSWLLLQLQVLPAHLASKAKTPWAATDGDRVGAERKEESTGGQ